MGFEFGYLICATVMCYAMYYAIDKCYNNVFVWIFVVLGVMDFLYLLKLGSKIAKWEIKLHLNKNY
jgi:hypothetical protein